MKTYTYTKSNELFARAKKVVPKGIYGHQGVGTYLPLEHFPIFSDHAQGPYFWDVDGNKFLDFMCAYGPNVLGYNDPDVDAAAITQLKKENAVTAPSYQLIEFAEAMTETVDMADWAFFAKNGGDVTSLAVMVAKAATGRKKTILVNGSYHGVAPWAQKPGAAEGIFEPDHTDNIYVDWNDIDQFEQAIRDHRGEVACFISTPYYQPAFKANAMPAEGYWQKIRKLCTDNGIVLIIDDVRCGFRLDLAGSDKYFGFKADLMCFCKSLANGWNVSALCGIDALREACEKVYYTGSYWMSAAPFAAGIACIKKLKELDGANYMLKLGRLYTDGLQEIAKSYGYRMDVSASPSLFYTHLVQNPDSPTWDYYQPESDLHKAWIGECVRRGVFMTNHHNHFTCCSMTEGDIKFALEVADDAMHAAKANF